MRSLLIATVALVCVVPLRAQTTVPAEAASLVPANTIAVVALPSLNRAEEIATQVLGHFGQPAQMAQGVLGRLRDPEEGPLGPLSEDLDVGRPILIAVAMPAEGGMEPEITVVLPMKDAKAAAEKMPGLVAGNWYAFRPMGGEGELNPTPHPMLEGLKLDQLTVRVHLAPILEQYGALLIGGIEMGASQVPTEEIPGLDIDSLIDGMVEATEAFVASGDKLEWTLGFDGTNLNHQLRVSWLEGSPIAKGATPSALSAASLAGMLPKDHMINYVSSYDMTGFMALYSNLIEGMGEQMGAQLGPMAAFLEPAMEMMKRQTGRQVLGLDLEPGNISMATVSEYKDGKHYIGTMGSMIDSMKEMLTELGVTIDTRSDLADGKPATMDMKLTLAENFDELAGAPGMRDVVSKILGGAISLRAIGTEDRIVAGMNLSAERMAELEARAKKPAAPPATLAQALALGGPNAQFAMSVDLGALARGITAIIKQVPEAPVENIPDYSKVSSALVWLGMGNAAEGFQMGAKVDLKAIGAIAKTAMK